MDLSKPPRQNRDLKKLGGLSEVSIKRHNRSDITRPGTPTVPQPFFQ
ncbi:hypothetical protein Pav037_1597 [Pseudomonas syringae pv. avellanae str. ISPaVe037]|nr:hypothetical protein Pav037_1597 [Pseudomonas syringae pv. avellanae str. ISPaVe037]